MSLSTHLFVNSQKLFAKSAQFRRLSALHSVVLLRVPDFLESTRISWCWTIWSDWRILSESVTVFCVQELVFVIFPQCLLHHGIFFASLGDSGEIRADNHDNCFMHWIGNSSSMHNDSMWERIDSLERWKNRRILVPFIFGTGRLFDESFHILGLQRCGRELATHTEQFSGWRHLGNHMEEEWVAWLMDAPRDYLFLKLTCKWNLTEGKWIWLGFPLCLSALFCRTQQQMVSANYCRLDILVNRSYNHNSWLWSSGGLDRAESQPPGRSQILAKFCQALAMVSFIAHYWCKMHKLSICCWVLWEVVLGESLALLLLNLLCSMYAGVTLGTPIAVVVPNEDQRGGVSIYLSLQLLLWFWYAPTLGALHSCNACDPKLRRRFAFSLPSGFWEQLTSCSKDWTSQKLFLEKFFEGLQEDDNIGDLVVYRITQKYHLHIALLMQMQLTTLSMVCVLSR